MTNLALDTMTRADKGPIEPPQELQEPLKKVAAAVASWAGVVSTAHWDLYDSSRVDGIDFYFGEQELAHIHLDGSLHLATSRRLGSALIAEGLARPFRYGEGWVCEKIGRLGPTAAIALIRRNYDRLLTAE